MAEMPGKYVGYRWRDMQFVAYVQAPQLLDNLGSEWMLTCEVPAPGQHANTPTKKLRFGRS